MNFLAALLNYSKCPILTFHPCFSDGTSKIKLKSGWFLKFICSNADGWRHEFTIVTVVCDYLDKESKVFQDGISLKPASEHDGVIDRTNTSDIRADILSALSSRSFLCEASISSRHSHKYAISLINSSLFILVLYIISQTHCRRHCSGDRTSGYSRPWNRPHPCNGWKVAQNLHDCKSSIILIFTVRR